MRRFMRPAIALMATASLALALGACGSGNSSSGSSSGGASGGASSGTVTWWSWSPDKAVADKYIKAFNAVYPDIKIEYTNYENADYAPSMSTAFQTGAGPDVFGISAGGAVAGKQLWGDYAMDLTSAAKDALGGDWKSKFATGYIDELTYSNKVVGLPLGGVAADFFWIDKDLFDKYKVPTELKTYDDLKKACDTFQANGVQCFTMGTNSVDTFPIELVRTIAASIDPTFYTAALHGTRSWTDPVYVQALDILRKMQSDGIIGQDATSIKQYPESNNNFLSGKAAIVQMGTWYSQYAVKASMIASQQGAGVSTPVPFTMLPMTSPDFAGKGNVPGMVGEVDYGLAVNTESKNKGAATTFVKWLSTTKEGQQVVASAIDLMPALVGVQPDWKNTDLVSPDLQVPAFQKLFAAAAAAPEARQLYLSAESGSAQLTAVQEVLSDRSKSTADIAAQVQANAVAVPEK